MHGHLRQLGAAVLRVVFWRPSLDALLASAFSRNQLCPGHGVLLSAVEHPAGGDALQRASAGVFALFSI
jgi:hypothetical protein